MIHVRNKRNNYIDGQFVDVDDFKTEQAYFIDRLRSNSKRLGNNGVADLKGLKVRPDTIMVEPINDNAVAVEIPASPDINAPNPQNFTTFPGTLGGAAFKLYTVFETKTTNVQRVDLRLTLAQAQNDEELDLIVRVQQLVDPTNPQSPLANVPPIAAIQLEQEDLPTDGSDDFLQLDFSNENSGQGIALLNNSYYALVLEFRRPVGSTSGLKVFHGPLDETSQVDPDLFTWVLEAGNFRQGFQNANGIFQQFQIYHRVYTSALQVTEGLAFIDGDRVEVEQDQFRFLEIPDRRNTNDTTGEIVFNYVVLRYKEEFTDPELVQATRNTVNTRIKDSASVEVLSQPQWEALQNEESERGNFLLLALVSDSNIVSIFDKKTFDVPENSTNLAFHDWLNPQNTSPTDEAINVKESRPTDFIFFVSNVPSQVPLTDSFGNIQRESSTILDEQGNVVRRAGDPILDDIVRVVVNVSLDDGANTRTLELSAVSEVGTNREFRNYAATISNLSDNPLDDVFSFNLSTDQITPNVVYNFVAFTRRGLPIFIQDYNRVVATRGATGEVESIRNKDFTAFLDRDSRTIVINEDLQLGAFNPASDTPQPGVTQFVSSLVQGEIPTPIGATQQEDIVVFDGTVTNPAHKLLSSDSFTFDPVPMVLSDNVTKIPNTDISVQTAYNNGDITIKVDNNDGLGAIDITFSGLNDRDIGGNGEAVLVTGNIDPSVSLSLTNTLDVKVRESLGPDPNTGELRGGKDNTNRSSEFTPFGPAQVGGPNNIRSFSLIARGYDGTVAPFSNAGFEDGDTVLIYVGDRQALDNNGNAISFVFDSNVSTVTLPTIFALGPRKYFREKKILSIENSTSATPGTVLIDTGLGTDGTSKEVGQVIFNEGEIPTSINPDADITLEYRGVEVTQDDIDFFRTQFRPIGTRDGFKIANTNIVSGSDEFVSVPEAFALTSDVNAQALDPATFETAAIFVDGINITSLISPIGQKEIVADTGATLQPGQVAFDPDKGTIKFFKQVDPFSGNITSEAPSDFTRITIAYFKLDTKFIFSSATSATYDPKFDINNDGHIDEQDLNVLTRALGTSIGDVNYIAAADFNNDGKVDDSDLDAFREHFGSVALGEPDYTDATTARLGALLIAKEDDFLVQLNAVRAVSRAPDAIAPQGRTVLFLDSNTPVERAGNYTVTFGFTAAMKLGFVQTEVETSRPLLGKINLDNIKMFETGNPSNTREIIQAEISTTPNDSNRFDNLLTFTPAITTSAEHTIRALWSEEGIAVFDQTELLLPQKHEKIDRQVYGPFKLDYDKSDFDMDGTSITFALKATDATFADGSRDPSGTHIGGVPLSELVFTIHLTLPNTDGQTSSIWTWHNVQPSGSTNRITLEFNDRLFIDHRIRGKDNAEVLTPFGLGANQVALKPKFAGGDIENDLANVSVIRSDVQSRYVEPHDHSNERSGGILTSRSVEFPDELARLEPGDLTETIYNLLDIIEDQNRQIELIRAIEGVVRWDRGFFWDDPNLFWDSN